MKCQRCATREATTTVAGLPMCSLCAERMAFNYGADVKTSGLSDVNTWGVLVPPLGVYQAVHGSGEGSSGGGGISGSVKEAGSAVSRTADAVKTVAIVTGVVVGAALIYIVYKQAENARTSSENMFRLFAEHPAARAAVTHGI